MMMSHMYDRESEAPGSDCIVCTAVSGHVDGSRRNGSPFGKLLCISYVLWTCFSWIFVAVFV